MPGKTATTKLTWLQDLKLGYKDDKGKDINNAVQLCLSMFKVQPMYEHSIRQSLIVVARKSEYLQLMLHSMHF